MKTTAQFSDGTVRQIRIQLSRSGEPFMVVFAGESWAATGARCYMANQGAPCDVWMYEMRSKSDRSRHLMVDAAGAFVHLE